MCLRGALHLSRRESRNQTLTRNLTLTRVNFGTPRALHWCYCSQAQALLRSSLTEVVEAGAGCGDDESDRCAMGRIGGGSAGKLLAAMKAAERRVVRLQKRQASSAAALASLLEGLRAHGGCRHSSEATAEATVEAQDAAGVAWIEAVVWGDEDADGGSLRRLQRIDNLAAAFGTACREFYANPINCAAMTRELGAFAPSSSISDFGDYISRIDVKQGDFNPAGDVGEGGGIGRLLAAAATAFAELRVLEQRAESARSARLVREWDEALARIAAAAEEVRRADLARWP